MFINFKVTQLRSILLKTRTAFVFSMHRSWASVTVEPATVRYSVPNANSGAKSNVWSCWYRSPRLVFLISQKMVANPALAVRWDYSWNHELASPASVGASRARSVLSCPAKEEAVDVSHVVFIRFINLQKRQWPDHPSRNEYARGTQFSILPVLIAECRFLIYRRGFFYFAAGVIAGAAVLIVVIIFTVNRCFQNAKLRAVSAEEQLTDVATSSCPQ